ncbi:plasma kallikrein, partial [Biomphalaria pfeifferi]
LLLNLYVILNLIEACQRSSPPHECHRPHWTHPPSPNKSPYLLPHTTKTFHGRTSGESLYKQNSKDWSRQTEVTTADDTHHDMDIQLSSCGTMANDPQGMIINGVLASEKSWPWMGMLKSERGLCGAVLISERWALTAAHCLPNVFDLTFGQRDRARWSNGTQLHSAHIEMAHPEYDKEKKMADIALIKLNESIEVTDSVHPICLPGPNMTYSACYVTGWGRTSFKSESSSRFLKQITVNIMPQNACAYKWKLDGVHITKKHLCLKIDEPWPHPGLCSGDSGSPLSCKSSDRYYVIALGEFVETGYPTVYFIEEFDDGWQDRRVESKHKSDLGKFYGDVEKDAVLQTSEDARFYGISARFDKFSNEGETLSHSIHCEAGVETLIVVAAM